MITEPRSRYNRRLLRYEVAVYPDSGKVMVRSLKRVGFLEKVDTMAGEPAEPKIFELAAKLT